MKPNFTHCAFRICILLMAASVTSFAEGEAAPAKDDIPDSPVKPEASAVLIVPNKSEAYQVVARNDGQTRMLVHAISLELSDAAGKKLDDTLIGIAPPVPIDPGLAVSFKLPKTHPLDVIRAVPKLSSFGLSYVHPGAEKEARKIEHCEVFVIR